MNTEKRILVVDDEETLRDTLAFNLEAEGYAVTTAASAEEALALPLQEFDLVLLDIMMGEISGTQLARILKANPDTAGVPVIFCTARDTEDDEVRGLELGADDYITKPFSLRALLARVHAVLRRAASPQPPEEGGAPSDRITYRGLTVLPEQKVCIVDGKEVKLPRKEFEILLKLLTHRGQVFSRAALLDEIWPDEVVVVDRVIDVNITRIRQKIGPYGKNIVTRSGYGYGFFEN